jgi:hypothetical protein
MLPRVLKLLNLVLVVSDLRPNCVKLFLDFFSEIHLLVDVFI